MNMLWIRLSSLLAVFVSAVSLAAQEAPEWEVEVEDNELVALESIDWHAKDYGWLLTFRLTTAAPLKLRPISHVRFEGLDAADEVVWEDSKTVRRKDLDSSLSGSDQLFLRMLFKEVPEEVAKLRIRFDNGDETTAGD